MNLYIEWAIGLAIFDCLIALLTLLFRTATYPKASALQVVASGLFAMWGYVVLVTGAP